MHTHHCGGHHVVVEKCKEKGPFSSSCLDLVVPATCFRPRVSEEDEPQVHLYLPLALKMLNDTLSILHYPLCLGRNQLSFHPA